MGREVKFGRQRLGCRRRPKHWLSLLLLHGTACKINSASWWPVVSFSAHTVWPNPSLKWSTNGMPPGLGRGCGHIFLSPGLASCRCCPLSSNVRPHKIRSLGVGSSVPRSGPLRPSQTRQTKPKASQRTDAIDGKREIAEKWQPLVSDLFASRQQVNAFFSAGCNQPLRLTAN